MNINFRFGASLSQGSDSNNGSSSSLSVVGSNSSRNTNNQRHRTLSSFPSGGSTRTIVGFTSAEHSRSRGDREQGMLLGFYL